MGAGGEAAPGGAPTMSPQAAMGDEGSADSQIQIAMRILEEALPKYGHGSDKGRAVLKMIQAGTRAFGRGEDRANQILPAELKSALMGAGPGGAPGPPGGGGPGGPGPTAPGGLPTGGSPTVPGGAGPPV